MAQGAPALPEASQGAPARPGVQQPRRRRSLRGWCCAADHPRSRFRWRSPTTLHPQAAHSRTGYVTSATCSGCTPRSSLRSRTRSKRRGHLLAISPPSPHHRPTVAPPSPHYLPAIPTQPAHDLPAISQVRRVVELNVIEQCLNIYKTGVVQRRRLLTSSVKCAVLGLRAGPPNPHPRPRPSTDTLLATRSTFPQPRVHALVYNPLDGRLKQLDLDMRRRRAVVVVVHLYL